MRVRISAAVIFTMIGSLSAQSRTSRSWSDLAQEVRPNWTVRLVLPDASVVEGREAVFGPETLSLSVVKTSNSALHPKGRMSLPRGQVTTLELCRNRFRGRWIGTMVPVVAGFGIAAAMVSGDLWGSARPATAALVGISGGGGVAGYFIGRHSDLKLQPIAVRP